MKMRITSPTLGKLDSVGNIKEIKRSGDYVIVSVPLDTDEGLDWNSKIALDHKDLTRMTWLLIKGRMPVFLITGLRHRSNPKPLPRKW